MKGNSTSNVLLVLHGNHQTGEILLKRMERLVKRLEKELDVESIAPDGPFPADAVGGSVNSDNTELRTWWKRDGVKMNSCIGLEESLEVIQSAVEETEKRQRRIVGILGFSRGARMAHFLAVLNQCYPGVWLSHLRFVVLVAGYDGPMPLQLIPYCKNGSDDNEEDNLELPLLTLPSLHVWGSGDTLISSEEFEANMASYQDPEKYIHPGRHHVPTKGAELPLYLEFIRKALLSSAIRPSGGPSNKADTKPAAASITTANTSPDEETAELQREEVQALDAIFPGAVDLRSSKETTEDCEEIFGFPIVYRITLNDMEMEGFGEDDDNDEDATKNWPKHPLTVEIRYPVNYPSDDLDAHEEATTVPRFALLHKNTVFEFPSVISGRLVSILQETARNERGMPCVLSCLYAARDFLDEDRDWDEAAMTVGATTASTAAEDAKTGNDGEGPDADTATTTTPSLIPKSSPSDVRKGTLEGLEIAQAFLSKSQQQQQEKVGANQKNDSSSSAETAMGRGAGSFGTYTIGLVGKPSTGKSTFFNAATAFSRQRGQHQEAGTGSNTSSTGNSVGGGGGGASSSAADADDDLGGASMAAHPFTTIDPNVGYCLVPAPLGSCPEDDVLADRTDNNSGVAAEFGSTHGRDPSGRRFLPVMLKDVAGLVPGAYQGKGRGNQFLNDLTDCTVLVHVVDSSGSADASGNKIVVDDDGGGDDKTSEHTNPLDDLAWIRTELVEWVYCNLASKWASISRRGRSKLAGMFSGYGQRADVVETVLSSLETFLEDRYQRDHALDRVYEWDECDVHRLVSLFLGVRFPMVLSLNKYDLPSSKKFVENFRKALPIHGAHAGTPLCAKKEMEFVKEHLIMAKKKQSAAAPSTPATTAATPPLGVWKCLESAIALHEPVVVFPVSDMATLAPLASLHKVATGDPSLPSSGMVRCIQASGGTAPSCWNSQTESYSPPSAGTRDNNSNNNDSGAPKLRDAILMKQGSTVEDVFFTLKQLGALGGDFIRAEASSGASGERPKPVKKQEIVTKKTRVIRIMTNKRTQWQASTTVNKERSRFQSKR